MIDWNYIASVIATVAFDIIYFGAIIGTIVIVILDNRNPVKTMAWILILMFLPVVGLVFYFFFGRSQRREKIIGKKSYNRLLKKPMAEYLAQNCCETPKEYARLIQLFQNTNQAFPFEGNRVDIYTGGYSKLQALLRELQKARFHIHMEYYIFEDDPVGFRAAWQERENEIAERIVAARRTLGSVAVPEDVMRAIVELAIETEVDGHRADIVMLKTVKAIAAWRGDGEAAREDVMQAARLVLPHRMRRKPFQNVGSAKAVR